MRDRLRLSEDARLRRVDVNRVVVAGQLCGGGNPIAGHHFRERRGRADCEPIEISGHWRRWS